MMIDWGRVLPVMVSIGVIITVAILRDYSRNFAAVAAVMPLNIPLGMWIVYAGAENRQQAMTDFSNALVVNIIPTMIFLLIAWQGSRAGWSLMPVIISGYAGWGIGLALIFFLRGIMM